MLAQFREIMLPFPVFLASFRANKYVFITTVHVSQITGQSELTQFHGAGILHSDKSAHKV